MFTELCHDLSSQLEIIGISNQPVIKKNMAQSIGPSKNINTFETYVKRENLHLALFVTENSKMYYGYIGVLPFGLCHTEKISLSNVGCNLTMAI